MAKRLTNEQLEEIRNRADNATAGEWEIYEKPDGQHIGTSWDHPQLRAPLPIVSLSIFAKEPHHRIYIDKEDADFIAHAREDIPMLLDEIKRLRKENHMFEQAIAEDDATKERLLNEINRLQSLMTHISKCAEEFYVDNNGVYEISEDVANSDLILEIFMVSSENSYLKY